MRAKSAIYDCLVVYLKASYIGWLNLPHLDHSTRPDSVYSDFGALQIIYLLTYLLTYLQSTKTSKHQNELQLSAVVKYNAN